ncbi:MAG TPA: hypothetical protein VNW97_17800 [Candidatus Saccharimonadales bacterium]|nr:hypothetical protein [Candidatus Saccharimonadales bacterium]
MELLSQLALLLKAYTPDHIPDPAQEALFARIAPSESLAAWLMLCRWDSQQAGQIDLLKPNTGTT